MKAEWVYEDGGRSYSPYLTGRYSLCTNNGNTSIVSIYLYDRQSAYGENIHLFLFHNVTNRVVLMKLPLDTPIDKAKAVAESLARMNGYDFEVVK